jgi:plastocyanin
MKQLTLLMSIILGLTLAQSAVAGDASITGTIKFDGSVPTMKVIKMNADPKCVANNKGKEVRAESLVMGEGQTVANIFVSIKSGLADGATYETPTTPVVVDQLGCRYIPHVVAAMKGQTVQIKNSDGTLHNVHGLPKTNKEFNVAMPAFKKQIEKKFDQVESPFKVKCDVHPWMAGYVAVMEHPYFAVSGVDGKYTIKGLDAGDYEVEMWHEKLGTQTVKVTVAAGEAKTQDFTLKKPGAVSLNAVMIVK